MKVTQEFLEERFKLFNEQIFKGCLPSVPLGIGHACTSLGTIRYKAKRSVTGQRKASGFHILLSDRFDTDESILEDTLIHEMIHLYLLKDGKVPSAPHGKAFQVMMQAINTRFHRHIKISHKASDAGIQMEKKARWRFVCVARFNDGRVGMVCVARSRIFEVERALWRGFQLGSVQWYASKHAFFDKYPDCRTPRLYKIEPEKQEELMAALSDAVIYDHVDNQLIAVR